MVRGATRSPGTQRVDPLPAVVAVAATCVALAAGLQPTGGRLIDPVLVTAAAAVTAATTMHAPWWALATASATAAAAVPPGPWTVVGLVALAASLCVGGLDRELPVLRAGVAVAVVAVLCHLGPQPFGIPSGVAGPVTATALIALGVRAGPARRRRPARIVAAVSAGAIALGLGTSAVAAATAATELRTGERSVRQARTALDRGDVEDARAAFGRAAVALDDADRRLDAWWAAPGAVVPVLAQHRSAGSAVTAAAAEALDRADDVLAAVDPAALQLRNGTIDLDAVAAVAGPLAELEAAGAALSDALAAADSPWLAGPVAERLAALRQRLDGSRSGLAQARAALAVAPALLGRDGERHYLVAFLNPAEARGLGGHMGNYAELTVSGGRIELSNFGRSVALNRRAPDPDGRVVTGPPEFLERWGRFGFLQADGTTDVMPWSTITMPPDLPTVAAVAAQLYPQSGGTELDGVITLLPEALAVFMRATGPVRIPELDRTIGPDDLARFIVRDQYELYAGEHTDRVDALETIAQTTFNRLLGTGKGRPVNLVGDLRALRASQGLAMWSRHADEQAFLTASGIDGAFPQLDGRDGIAVTVDNGGANKLDAYLEVATTYRSSPQPDGSTTATATITITNTVDPTGKPDYAVGNLVGLPRGTNRMMLSLYSAIPARAISLDGRPVTIDGRTAEIAAVPTFGWRTAAIWVDVPAGATRVVTVELAGTLEFPGGTGTVGDGPVVVRRQPMPIPQRYDIATG